MAERPIITIEESRIWAKTEITHRVAEELMKQKGVKSGLCEVLCPDCIPECPIIQTKIASIMEAIRTVPQDDPRIGRLAQEIYIRQQPKTPYLSRDPHIRPLSPRK